MSAVMVFGNLTRSQNYQSNATFPSFAAKKLSQCHSWTTDTKMRDHINDIRGDP